MDFDIHPELSKLRNDFLVSKSEYEKGFLSAEDLEFTRKHMELIDSAGYHWSIDDKGSYIRWYPGEEVMHTPGIYFAKGERPAYTRENSEVAEGSKYKSVSSEKIEKFKIRKRGLKRDKVIKKISFIDKDDRILTKTKVFLLKIDHDHLKSIFAISCLVIAVIIFAIII